jgi:class 3 adenylate cyclase
MRCTACGTDNREGRKFCAQCGQPLKLVCSACGAGNELGERFCGDCGVALGETHPSNLHASTSAEARASGHLTVLFCDLVGSTALSAQLDPEEWRETVADYHRVAADAVGRFGGYVAQYLGDGMMAYFGWPEAHDNDGERAARAGLAILDAHEAQRGAWTAEVVGPYRHRLGCGSGGR